jgi:hypothetical protein
MMIYFRLTGVSLHGSFSIIAGISRFEAEPSHAAVSLGQTAVFECRMQQPQASLSAFEDDWYNVSWLKDDQPLVLDHRMKKMTSGMLEITDVRLSDRAAYRCNVTNVDGSESRLSKIASLKLIFDGGKSI